MLRKALLTALLALAGITEAQAAPQYCVTFSRPGWLVINHRQGMLYGGNFWAQVSCTWNAPVFVYWRGGAMCTSRRFYGRNLAGSPYSCLVRRVGWR